MKNLFSVFVPLYVANIRIIMICSKFFGVFEIFVSSLFLLVVLAFRECWLSAVYNHKADSQEEDNEWVQSQNLPCFFLFQNCYLLFVTQKIHLWKLSTVNCNAWCELALSKKQEQSSRNLFFLSENCNTVSRKNWKSWCQWPVTVTHRIKSVPYGFNLRIASSRIVG